MGSNKLYAGNLDYDVSNEDLGKIFEPFGMASVSILMNKETGKSMGFGFVEMKDEESAKKAISELHGRDFMGRPLKVSIAKEREIKPGVRESRYIPGTKTLYVGNLPYEISTADITKFFSGVGYAIKSIKIIYS